MGGALSTRSPDAIQVVGTVFLAYVRQMEKRGLYARVRARAGAELARALDKRPLAVSWVGGGVLVQLAEALETEIGADGVRELARASTKESVGPLIAPIARATVSIFGGTPDRLFSRIETALSITNRGCTFSWERLGDQSGVLRIDVSQPMPVPYWRMWEGALEYVYDLCKVAGKVVLDGVAAPSPFARFRAEWQPA